MNAIVRPCAASIPARTAAPLPLFCSRRTTRSAPAASAAANVSSGDPSSTTTISRSRPIADRARRAAARQSSPINAAALYAGTTTLKRRSPGAEPGRRRAGPGAHLAEQHAAVADDADAAGDRQRAILRHAAARAPSRDRTAGRRARPASRRGRRRRSPPIGERLVDPPQVRVACEGERAVGEVRHDRARRRSRTRRRR